jgi:hypothetical protein
LLRPVRGAGVPDPIEEQQARRIEEADGWCVEQALVEGSRPTKIIGVLRDLQDIHEASVARGLRAALLTRFSW